MDELNDIDEIAGVPFYNFTNTYNVDKLITDPASIKGYEDIILDVLRPLSVRPRKGMMTFCVETNIDSSKNAKKASELREKGNKLYVKCKTTKDFVQVLKAYNESIAVAPRSSEELALAYGNRAMVLFRCHYYKECLADINRALCLNYPDRSVGKLLIKRVRCMKILDHPDLLVTYEDCLKWITKHLTNVKEMESEVKEAYEADVIHPPLTPIDTKFRDDLLEHMKKECPDLKKLEVRENCHGDLALYATRDIQVNEVIGVQKIFTKVFHIEEPYLACWQCVMMCLNPIPCDGCSAATYCSEECKAEAWNKYHEYECQIMGVIKQSMREFLLSIRICMIAMKQLGGILPLMKEIYKMSKSTDVHKEHRIVNGTYASDSYRSVYYMISKTDIAGSGYGMNVMKVTSFVRYLAMNTTLFGQKYTQELYPLMLERPPRLFAALILRHFVMTKRIQKEEWKLPNNIVMGSTPICPLFHIVDHSCNPNTVKITLKDHQILVAIDSIKKGEEITYSYYHEILMGADPDHRNSVLSDNLPFLLPPGLAQAFGCQMCDCRVCSINCQHKLRSISKLERNRKKLSEMIMLNNEIMNVISKHEEQKPKTASEFVEQTADLCEKLIRPFFAKAPSVCKEVISHKSYLLNTYWKLHSDINNFMGCQDP